jgi:hypothetical protein
MGASDARPGVFGLCPLVHIIHDGSSRNRVVALRDGYVEPRAAEAYLKQYVEVARGEPARRRLVTAANPRLQQKCSGIMRA